MAAGREVPISYIETFTRRRVTEFFFRFGRLTRASYEDQHKLKRRKSTLLTAHRSTSSTRPPRPDRMKRSVRHE